MKDLTRSQGYVTIVAALLNWVICGGDDASLIAMCVTLAAVVAGLVMVIYGDAGTKETR